MARNFFITGTDTGVGKTVFTSLLARHLRERGVNVAALKPVCSGNRDDARALHGALGGALSLDEINPWHFRAPLAPLLAARREKRKLTKADIVAHARGCSRRFAVVLIEGAGGLLTPLGEGFDSRDLIAVLSATPLIVASNRLGAVNQVRLVLAALPVAAARRAEVVLVNPSRADAASRSNAALLEEFIPSSRLHSLPWIGAAPLAGPGPLTHAVRRTMDRLVKNLSLLACPAQ